MTNKYMNIALQRPNEFAHFKEEIFKHTLKWEGGGKLHNVRGDSGGWTIWGVAYNHNKKLFNNLVDFKDTTYDEAAAIAFVKYYLAVRTNLVPIEARLMYFDIAYNMGNKQAIRMMQRCIGVDGDGIIGAVTESKMGTLTEECLFDRRTNFYNSLARRKVRFKRFLRGWLNRTNDIFKIK